MITREHVITIGGTPVPKGSLKCVGTRGGRRHQLIEDNPATDEWRRTVALAVRHATWPNQADKHQPIGVEITSTLPRPARHFGTGKNTHTPRPTAPQHPATGGTGDVDKLARLILDALQDADVLHDDAQVIEVVSRKAYPETPVPDALDHLGVRIRLYPIEGEWT
jgi:Holliday junction resolvase RusA-like endonuclease